MKFTLVTYQEHALEKSSSSKAIAYVGIQKPDGTLSWGDGVDPDIIRASISALVVAVNKILEVKKVDAVQDERFVEMQNYIQANYQTVTLGDMAEQFHLSEPYISKYIKEK